MGAMSAEVRRSAIGLVKMTASSLSRPFSLEEIMKRLLLVSVFLSVQSVAFAHCAGPVPCEMKYVDVAFLKTKRTGADVEKAKAMREEGEKLFKEGKEDEALKLLQEAKKFLLEGS